jgi:hypothetical protein
MEIPVECLPDVTKGDLEDIDYREEPSGPLCLPLDSMGFV